jgi:hypothetical protein
MNPQPEPTATQDPGTSTPTTEDTN